MIKLLEQAIDRVRALPADMQEQAAHLLLAYAGDEGPVYILTLEERADLAEADAEIARGEFADDENVRAMWAKHGL